MTSRDFLLGTVLGGLVVLCGLSNCNRLANRISMQEHEYQEVLAQKKYTPEPEQVVMNWDRLIMVTALYQTDIKKYTVEVEWQIFRESLKGEPLQRKYLALERWLQEKEYSFAARVQVTNYVNALKRGGLI